MFCPGDMFWQSRGSSRTVTYGLFFFVYQMVKRCWNSTTCYYLVVSLLDGTLHSEFDFGVACSDHSNCNDASNSVIYCSFTFLRLVFHV